MRSFLRDVVDFVVIIGGVMGFILVLEYWFWQPIPGVTQ